MNPFLIGFLIVLGVGAGLLVVLALAVLLLIGLVFLVAAAERRITKRDLAQPVVKGEPLRGLTTEQRAQLPRIGDTGKDPTYTTGTLRADHEESEVGFP